MDFDDFNYHTLFVALFLSYNWERCNQLLCQVSQIYYAKSVVRPYIGDMSYMLY